MSKTIDSSQWQAWMIAAQQGDNSAYTRLLESLLPVLRGYVGKRLFDTHQVEDVVQTILLAVHQARHTYNSEQPFTPWLFAIARFKLIDAMRGSGKTVPLADDYETFLPDEQNKTLSADNRLDLNRLLHVLPRKQRDVVALMKIQGLSAEEVAGKTGMSVSAVKVTAHRAYKKLRDLLNA